MQPGLIPAHTGAIQNILVAQLLMQHKCHKKDSHSQNSQACKTFTGLGQGHLFHLELIQPPAMSDDGFLLHSKLLMQLFLFQDSPSLHLPEQRRVRGHLGEAGREAPGQRRSRFEHFWSLTLVRLFHTSEYV